MPLRFATPTREAHRSPLLVGRLLDAALVHSPEQEIVQDGGRTLSYRQLRERIGRLASALAGLGVQAGDTVAVLDWDSHRYLEAYFAVPMMGAVLQTVNIRLSPEQVGYTLRHGAARVVISHRDFLPFVERWREATPGGRAILVDGGGGGLELDEYEELLAAAEPGFPFADFDEEAIATTFYTTGTTGLPKAVVFTHRQIVLHALMLKAPMGAAAPGLGVGGVYMPLTPMFHVHAWGYPFVATMLGVRQVYPGRYEAGRLLAVRGREGVTFSHCVPTVLQMLVDRCGEDAARLDGWTLVVGGAALSRTLFDRATALGAQVIVGYGMSETGPLVAMGRPSPDAPADAMRTGCPVPLVFLRVVDDAMQDVARDDLAHGEVVVRAPWLTPCYPGDEAASADLWRGGWLHTQDVATMRADGSVQVRDRLKDVIKSGGEWICSLTLEEIAARHPGVAEIAVVGRPDERWGERPVAMVVVRGQATPTLADINALIASAAAEGLISRYAALDRLTYADVLPRTSVGKIDKKAVREAFSDVNSDLSR